jgi:hypothetical protein
MMADLGRFVHSALTMGGRAMHTIQNQFNEILGQQREHWSEQHDVKQVRSRVPLLLFTWTTDSAPLPTAHYNQ